MNIIFRRTIGTRLTKLSATGEGFLVTPLLEILQQAMEDDPDKLIERYRGIYGFKVKKGNGEEGYWVINAKVGKGKIEYNGKSKNFLPSLY